MVQVEFKGKRLFYVWDNLELGQSGALAYPEHVEDGDIKPECVFEDSYAHLCNTGEIKRYGKVIGHVSDLKVIEDGAPSCP